MRNTFPITEKVESNNRYLLLDTNKTVFRRLKWNDLGDYGKRKCENFIFLENQSKERKYVKVIYAPAFA